MNDLYENGFLILPNKNKKETFEKHANDFYKDNNVYYPLLKQFIDREYFTELGKLTNIIENINKSLFPLSIPNSEELEKITKNITDSMSILIEKKLDLFSSTVNNKK